MPWVQFLRNHDVDQFHWKTNDTADLRPSHAATLVRQNICKYISDPNDQVGLSTSDINTIAKLNAIVQDATLGDVFTGTEGSVVFVGSDTFLAEDNDKFFWDDTEDRLIINGGTSPLATLHVEEALSADNDLALFRRTASEPTAFSMFVGPSGSTPDFAVWGDGRVSIGETEVNTNAMLRINHPASAPAGGTAACLFVDSDDTGSVVGIELDHEGTTGDAISVTSQATTGFGLDIQCNALTSGNVASFRSNSSSAVSREVVEIVQDHVDASNALPLYVRNDANGLLARFLNLSSATIFEWHCDGYWKIGALPSTDVAPSTANPPYKMSLQELGADPTNAAFLKFSNWPNSPTTELYLVVEDG